MPPLAREPAFDAHECPPATAHGTERLIHFAFTARSVSGASDLRFTDTLMRPKRRAYGQVTVTGATQPAGDRRLITRDPVPFCPEIESVARSEAIVAGIGEPSTPKLTD